MEIILLLIAKTKMFLYGFLAGSVLHWFELDLGKTKFNLGKFLISSATFGVLTQFSFLFVEGNILSLGTNNSSREVVISVALASFMYIFIPFVLQKDNRDRFIVSIFERFGFYKKND